MLQWVQIVNMLNKIERYNTNLNEMFEDIQCLFAGKSCPQILSSCCSDGYFSDEDRYLDESSSLSSLSNEQHPSCSPNDTVDTTLDVYSRSTTAKVKMSFISFG